MIVSMEGIFKDYQQGKVPVPVLKDIHLQVAEGEYLAIMGPSGSGKTTLMNLIGCLDRPTSGTYLLADEDVSVCKDDRLAELRNRYIGFVFQNFYLLPKMNALENVALPLLYAGVNKKERLARAQEALNLVGLSDRMSFRPNQLSGGQCQRVAIARALVGNPQLLLADEPTGALDTASGDQVMDLFDQIHQTGTTIIMITHEPAVAQRAEKIYHIRDGILHCDGAAPVRAGGNQASSASRDPLSGLLKSTGSPRQAEPPANPFAYLDNLPSDDSAFAVEDASGNEDPFAAIDPVQPGEATGFDFPSNREEDL